MHSISSVSEIIGVARSTLLYYERIGIITPQRNPENGYREFSRADIDTLLLVRQLQQAGFSLKEVIDLMAGTLDPQLIRERYRDLEAKIKAMSMAKEVVGSLLACTTGERMQGDESGGRGRDWHAAFERKGAEAHSAWLQRLGFSEKERLYIRWVTRNISNYEVYMKHFFKVFERMKRQGPGGRATTLKAFEKAAGQGEINTILDVGCGKGASSLVLAEISDAFITAVDNHQPFLDHLKAQAGRLGVDGQIATVNMSMSALDFPCPSFDLIWSEGSAYIMGFEKALEAWRPLVNPAGFLFVSEAVWLTDRPSPACADYWRVEYPVMTDVKTRKAQARQLGYDILSWFILPREDWTAFYDDMEACVTYAIGQGGMAQTFEDFINEIEIDRRYGHEYGYLCLLLRRQD